MTRFAASLRKDAVIQLRSGFWVVGAVVAFFYVGLLYQIPSSWPLDLELLLPAILLLNVMITTFYFVAALVLMEKTEGTLAALVVTPLRTGEYLGAKVSSLALLALAENGVVVLLFYGTGFAPLQLVAGLGLLCAFYTLLGFVVISRYESINEFLIPSIGVVTFLALPLLAYFGAVDRSVFYVHPIQPYLLLIRAGFVAVSNADVIYAVTGSLVWTFLAWWGARRAFLRLAVR